MSKGMKRVGIGVGIVLLVVIVVLGGVLIYLDSIAKAAIEKGGTYALGVETTLEDLDIGLFAGTAELKGLHVANPEGFSPTFFALREGEAAVSLGSLTSDTVTVPLVHLKGVTMTLEKKDGKANYDVILENLEKISGGGEETSTAEEEAAPGKKFIINKLIIEDINVTAQLPVGGKFPVKIDRIELNDLGSDTSGGVVLSELWATVIKAIFQAVVEKAGGVLGDIGSELKNGLTELGGKAGELMQGLGEGAKGLIGDGDSKVGDAVEGVGGAVKDVGAGLKNLLGGDKKKDTAVEDE